MHLTCRHRHRLLRSKTVVRCRARLIPCSDRHDRCRISQLRALLIALILTVAPFVSSAQAVENARKVSVVSFGLFGDQGVLRREATSAAQIVADRFGDGPVDVQYNSKKGGGATIQTLAASLQSAADAMEPENDVLFLILTSH